MKLLFAGEGTLYTDMLTGKQYFDWVHTLLGRTWERGRGRKDLRMRYKKRREKATYEEERRAHYGKEEERRK